MSYSSELTDNPTAFQTNIVIDIDGVKYAKQEPDSGLVVPVTNRIVHEVKINPTVIDLKKAITKVNTTTVTVIDKDEIFSIAMGADDSGLIGKVIEVFMGRTGTAVGGSFAFADYISINKYKIRDIIRRDRFYVINAVEDINEAQVPIYDISGNLTSAISDTASSITFKTNTDTFASAGFVRIDDEFIEYSGKSFVDPDTTITGATRGTESSVTAAHLASAEVQFFEKLEANPIDMIQQILISNGGGGGFDVLFDGVGIDASLIDTAGFASIKSTFFSTETFRLFLGNIPNALKYIQDELLLATNTRLIQNQADNKIGLAILDQSDFGASVTTIDGNRSMPNPKWRTTSKGIQNSVRVQWDWSEGLQAYKEATDDDDTISQGVFGLKKGPRLRFKGIQSDLSGSTIVDDRTSRFLARFSTPQQTIDVRVFMEHSLINVGDKIRYQSTELPTPGGALGYDSILELLSSGVSASTGLVNHRYVTTSFTNQRVALIAPSPIIGTVTSQSVFDVPAGVGLQYLVGDKVKLWDNVNQVFFADAVNEITVISTDTLTVQTAWVTTLGTNVTLKVADYNDASNAQHSRFSWIADGVTEVFDDATKAFQIIL